MTTHTIANAIQDSSVSTFLRSIDHDFIVVFEVVHVLGLLLLLSPLVVINLRLLGVVLKQQAVAQVFQAFYPFMLTGLIVAVFSGTSLFLTFPVMYYNNPMFLPKIGLLFLAVTVQLALVLKTTKQTYPNPLLAKSAALVSLTLWFGIGFAGRAIGFV
jgi:tellurite resistance protein TehA-like permease